MLVSATSALNLPAMSDAPARTILPPVSLPPAPTQKRSLNRNFCRLPLAFERNQGQTDARVRFLTHSGDSALFLTPSEAVFTLASQPAPKHNALRADRKGGRSAEKIGRVALRMQIVGTNTKATALTRQPLSGKVNYFIGKDRRQWHTDVPTFGKVGFQGVYPGVDLVYYGNQTHLEYDFLVAPHADPQQIQLHFAGAQGVHIDASGNLIVRAAGRELKWRRPLVYQEDAAGKHAVTARFQRMRLPNGQTGIRFALGHYNVDRPLIIDPVLLYSTYLGGSSNGATARGVAIDSGGNAYITGSTTSVDFPTTAGAFQTVNVTGGRGNGVAFVSKINATGTALVYSTYLGGTSTEDSANGIAVDAAGNAYVTGITASGDFPTTPGVFQPANHTKVYTNAFVTKLNPTGTVLVYSTYLGGSSTDQAYSIAVDSSGSAYVTGTAISRDFPTTPGAVQPTTKAFPQKMFPGNAFVTKLNPTGTAPAYSTYLGGTQGGDKGTGIAVDNNGNAFITGITFSADFPTTPTAFQPTYPAGIYSPTSFVTKLNSVGTALVYSTYLGGSDAAGDMTNGIAIDNSGNAYVAGRANSSDFPTTPGAFQRARKSTHSSIGFVTKLNFTGTALLYSTYLGGGNSSGDGANAIAVDGDGDAYVAGNSTNPDFPTTPGAFQRVNGAHSPPSVGTANTNAFVTKLSPTGATLLYSTFLGGTNGIGAFAVGIGIDPHGNAYVVGNSTSSDFPTTPGALQPGNGSVRGNAFVTKLSPVRILPDFNKDDSTDLLLQNSATNQVAAWFMQGSNWVGGAYFSLTPPSDYALIGTGDFSSDGKTTLVFQSRTTRQVIFWTTSGTDLAAISGSATVDTTPAAGWKVVGIGDFNGDGKSDLVFQNQTSNEIAFWYMNGTHVQSGESLSYLPPTGWKLVGVGDVNADGASDLVFQDQATGRIAIWFMFGKNYLDGLVLTTVPFSDWKAVGVGDYNGDGYADLLFQNQTTNQGVVWYLRNGAYADGSSLSLYPPPGWNIVGPR